MELTNIETVSAKSVSSVSLELCRPVNGDARSADWAGTKHEIKIEQDYYPHFKPQTMTFTLKKAKLPWVNALRAACYECPGCVLKVTKYQTSDRAIIEENIINRIKHLRINQKLAGQKYALYKSNASKNQKCGVTTGLLTSTTKSKEPLCNPVPLLTLSGGCDITIEAEVVKVHPHEEPLCRQTCHFTFETTKDTKESTKETTKETTK